MKKYNNSQGYISKAGEINLTRYTRKKKRLKNTFLFTPPDCSFLLRASFLAFQNSSP